jgi:cytochrome c oxidase subunit 3
MSTGFHGLHVIVGTIFLIVCFVRLRNRSGEENLSFTPERHLGFECAAYY